MAEQVAVKRFTLSNSTFKARPNFKAYIQVDTNAGLDSVEQVEAKRRARQMKFPSLGSNKDSLAFKEPTNNPSFREYNDEGDYRPPAPTRFYDNLVDPVSGFLSAGGDLARKTGVDRLKMFTRVSDTPQDHVPHLRNSVRMVESAPPQLHRQTMSDPPQPSYWNSRKTLDISTRAKLGGWTSVEDPRKAQKEAAKGVYQGPADMSREIRDKLALQYMYKSSTQRQYEDIPWDNMLAPKVWSPPKTFEPKPDQVDQRFSNKRYAPDAQEYQLVGKSWDSFQTRNGYYKKQPWIDYTSPCPRAKHMPLYGGCVGADNLDEIDNQKEPFSPYTVKRVDIPREAATSHRPNIPGYTGCTLYKSVRQPDTTQSLDFTPQSAQPATRETSPPDVGTSTGDVYRPIPMEATPENKRESHMSKMVTLVPPHNPFSKVHSMPQSLKI